MTTLRSTISQLANEFAAGVLEAIRGASLQEILAESGAGGAVKARRGRPPATEAARGAAPAKRRGRGGRLGRRSAGDIAGLVEQIVELLEGKPDGLRAEQIREQLGLEAKELPRPIAEALASRRIAKQGQKRATTYFARGGGGARAKGGSKAAGGAKKSGKKSAGKAAKKAARGGKRASKKRSKASASSNGAAVAS